MSRQPYDPVMNRQYQLNWQRDNPAQYLVSSARNRATKRGILFSLTAEDIVLPSHCPYLGMRLEYGGGNGRKKPQSASLDRILPELGYVPGNVEVISCAANSLKGGGSLSFLKKVVAQMEITTTLLAIRTPEHEKP